jgi:hypothetical protein
MNFTLKKKGLNWKFAHMGTLTKCNKNNNNDVKYLHWMMAIQTYTNNNNNDNNNNRSTCTHNLMLIMNSQDPKGNFENLCWKCSHLGKKKRREALTSLLNALGFLSYSQIMWPNTQQCTIHWKPVMTPLWMNYHDWVTLVTYPTKPVILLPSPTTKVNY